MNDRTRQRVMNGEIWIRGLFMLLYLIAYNITEFIIVLLSIFQFFAVLITGRANEALLEFGNNLSVYAYEIFQFLTFNSEIKPFPFSPWPEEEIGGEVWLADEPEATEPEVAASIKEASTKEVSSEEVASEDESDQPDKDKAE